MKAVVVTTAWLGAGLVAAGALYWGFLNTPESNAAMLAASALLFAAVVAVIGVAVNGAVLEARTGTLRAGEAVRALPGFAAASIVALAVRWLAGTGASWTEAHAGEISAWFIATAGWSDVRWLLTSAAWFFSWAAWVAGPVIAISLLARLVAPGETDGGVRWLTRAFHWRVLGLATLWFALLVWLPWQAAPGRPAAFPTGAMEPALAALKLAAIGLVMTAGLGLVIRIAAGHRSDRVV
ncbi:MAG: hypothetical protein AB7H88_09340 [Vicinamibacterales bacterium]